MMNMNGMMDRCMEMMGGDTMGNNIVLILLFALLLVWVIGLGAAGVIGF